jgi:DNA-binding NarL/FixJ family response regulator
MTPDADNRKKRVLIVDDHPLVRDGLAALINQQSDLKVCGQAASALEGIKLIAAAKPDMVIVNTSKAGGYGIDLIKNIKATCPQVVVIVLSLHDEIIQDKRALRAGGRGGVRKQPAAGKVLQAIRCVLDGKLGLVNEIAGMLAGKRVEDEPFLPDFPGDLISDREFEVFRLMGRGCSTRQIAEQMRISDKTVHSFRSRIKHKLKLSSAAEVLREALLWHHRQNLK